MPANIDTLTFGAELEMILPDGLGRDEAAAALRARGINANAEVYNHNRRPQWKIVTDGSLTGNGAEAVSPVLTGEAGLAELATVCEALQDLGATVNRSCGFHVHVGAAGQQLKFFKDIVRLYAKFETVIDGIMPASRRGSANHYCQSVATVNPASLAGAGSMEMLTGRLMPGRYWKVNLQSFARHSTVEFRQHSGTLDPVKAVTWVRLCLRMAARAAEGIQFEQPSRASIARNTARPGSKRHTIVNLIMRDGGATRQEIVEATNWPSVSIAQIAQSTGLNIVTERRGNVVRYRLNQAAPNEAVAMDVSIRGFCELIGATETERQYMEARSRNLAGPVQWAA